MGVEKTQQEVLAAVVFLFILAKIRELLLAYHHHLRSTIRRYIHVDTLSKF